MPNVIAYVNVVTARHKRDDDAGWRLLATFTWLRRHYTPLRVYNTPAVIGYGELIVIIMVNIRFAVVVVTIIKRQRINTTSFAIRYYASTIAIPPRQRILLSPIPRRPITTITVNIIHDHVRATLVVIARVKRYGEKSEWRRRERCQENIAGVVG